MKRGQTDLKFNNAHKELRKMSGHWRPFNLLFFFLKKGVRLASA